MNATAETAETARLVRLCHVCREPLAEDVPFSICDACSNARMAEAEAQQKKELHAERVHRWTVICPPIYQSTDWRRDDLSPVCRDLAANWWQKKRGIGLGIHGRTGRGKSRAMFEILRRHHFAGRHCMAIQSMDIEEACAMMWANDPVARQQSVATLKRCRTAGILYIDDLGKERMSESVAKEFHRLVEHRCRERLPLLWTSEQSGDFLAQRMGQAYGAGLIRRLREFCDIYSEDPAVNANNDCTGASLRCRD